MYFFVCFRHCDTCFCSPPQCHALIIIYKTCPLSTQVMFPVLQMLGDGEAQVGHYFLLVLNLRNQRFVVLDSMRSLEDAALFGCCTTLIGRIKELWIEHKYEEDKPISNYELVDICVPVQSNK